MPKAVEFVGDSRERLQEFPDDPKLKMGYAIWVAQQGKKASYAKPMKGLGGGATVIEICDDFDGDTYRVMYTVKIGEKLYVLHAFQKKSRKGVETPKSEIEILNHRLRQAKILAQRDKVKD